MSRGSVFGPQLSLLYTAELVTILENMLYGYADDSTLVAVVPSPGEREAVTEFLNLNTVTIWYDLCGIKLNARKTQTYMMVPTSRTIHPQSTLLTPNGTVLKESVNLFILDVTLDAKMTSEKHLRSVSRAAAQRLLVMRKCLKDLMRSFWCFVLPTSELLLVVF